MAYSDESVSAKLSALNETQESIVTVAQWVMFHRRHADRTAQLWLQKVREANPHKRLNLVYLANEVVQQSKVRRKEDFLIAFSPIIAEATAIAFKGAPTEIQLKLRRVVEVWRQRHIFDDSIQDAVEARVAEIDRNKSTGKKPLGGSLFSSTANAGVSIPPELKHLPPLQVSISKAATFAPKAVETANVEYDKLNGPSAQIPTPPVYAARLSQLLKTFANAQNHLSTAVKSREELILALEKLVDTNHTALSQEKRDLESIEQRQGETEQKKKDVEDAIMKGLNYDPSSDGANKPLTAAADEPEQPAVEALTPPVETLTPVGSPKPSREPEQPSYEQWEQRQQQPPPPQPPQPPQPGEQPLPTYVQPQAASEAPAQTTVPNLPDLLNALAAKTSVPSMTHIPEQPQAPAETLWSTNQQSPPVVAGMKRRKLDEDGNEDSGRQSGANDATRTNLDSEVDELLKQEGGRY